MMVSAMRQVLASLNQYLLKDLRKKVVVNLRNSIQAFRDNDLWELLTRFVIFCYILRTTF